MDIESVCKSPNVREAMEQDYSFLRLSCAWGRIANYPLPLLLQRKSVAGESFFGNIIGKLGALRIACGRLGRYMLARLIIPCKNKLSSHVIAVLGIVGITIEMRLYGLSRLFDYDSYDEGVYWQTLRAMHAGYS